MKVKNYRKIRTDEIVYEEDALQYVLEKLGITLSDNCNTLEQLEFTDMIVEWYFSGDWIEEWEEI